jgi:threonine dehydratase
MTIADGARTISLGDRNWEIIKDNVEEIFEIDEESIALGVRNYFELANLKCEPTGALSLAAVTNDPTRFRDQRVCVVVSGGNVDTSVYRSLIG